MMFSHSTRSQVQHVRRSSTTKLRFRALHMPLSARSLPQSASRFARRSNIRRYNDNKSSLLGRSSSIACVALAMDAYTRTCAPTADPGAKPCKWARNKSASEFCFASRVPMSDMVSESDTREEGAVVTCCSHWGCSPGRESDVSRGTNDEPTTVCQGGPNTPQSTHFPSPHCSNDPPRSSATRVMSSRWPGRMASISSSTNVFNSSLLE
mmetsp:Transcript_11849/g.22567  ORF Transcript_11849/g.22567 Transcript_11849/m.22567 type:complete len:209 (-) Transcript_11849:375-1001(-)